MTSTLILTHPVKNINLLNGLKLAGIQAYKEGVGFISFYELRDYNGFKSHSFIKCVKEEGLNIKSEIKSILKGWEYSPKG